MLRFRISSLMMLAWLSFTGLGQPTSAQILGSRSFTLSEAVSHALRQQENLQKLRIDAQVNNQKVREYLAKWLPQLTGNLEFRYNAIRPTSILPGEIAGQPGENVPVQFGTRFNTNASLDVDWTVYAPQIGPDLKLARLNIELARKDLQRDEVETRYMVTRAYLAVLLSKENLANQQINLQRQQILVQELEARVKASQAEPFDLERAQLQLNNLQVAVERSAMAADQSLLSLKYQMAYPLDRDLVLVDSLLLKEYQEEAAPLASETFQPERRVEWKIQATQLNQRILDFRKARNAYIPTVSLIAQAGSQFQSNRFNLFDFSNSWFGAVFVGARVQVPLFDGLQRDAKIKQARLALAQSRLTQQALNRQLEYEVQDARLSYATAVRHLTEQKNNVIIAERALNRIQARYLNSQETYSEVENLRVDLLRAQNNYFITLYDLAVARLTLLKATGGL